MLYFVVRTDVTAKDGLQRVFGVFDTRPEADAFCDDMRNVRRGDFAVFEGSPAE